MTDVTRPLRVLTVTNYFISNGYGIEGIATRLNDQFRRRGYDVRWLSSTVTNKVARSFPQSADDVGIPSCDPIREFTDLGFALFAPWWLGRIFAEVRRADIVHLHEAFYPLQQASLWSAVLLRRPIVITQHIADMPISGVIRGNLVRLANLAMTRPAFAVASKVVYYSRRTQAHFAEFTRGKDALIWNGCDNELFAPRPPEEIAQLRRDLKLPAEQTVALFVGRLIEKKGLHALRELAVEHPEVLFVFVGNGPLDPGGWRLRNAVVRPQVPQEELRSYYQASDVLLLPAVGEGFPLVVQEACCSGLPSVVSTEVLAACPEMAPHVYDAGEAGRHLPETFARFLEAREAYARRLERAAFARKLWSWERCGGEYGAIFEALADQAHSACGERVPRP